MRLPRNRLVCACVIFLVGAGCGFLAKTIAAYTDRSRFIGELQQRIAAERRASETLASIINESGHILKRMEDSIGGTAEGVSGVAGRLRIYAKETAELEALVDRYRGSELRGGSGGGSGDRPRD